MGDGDAEARPKALSRSKDSTTVDEDRLQLHNLELTTRVAMLEAEVSKLRHQVSMHEAHQCSTVPTPCLVSVGTQIDAYFSTDATKKGEMIPMEEDSDSLDDSIQEQVVFQSTLFKPAFVQVHDLPASDDEDEETSEDWKLVVRAVDEMLTDAEDKDQTYTSFNIIPEAAAIITWGYDGKSERFWIGWEFGGVEELNWDFLNSIQVLHLYHLQCINNSQDLSAELAIGRFYDLMEDNLPNIERQIQAVKRVAYPESSTTAERRLTPRRLEIIRSSLLTEEEVLCWRIFLYNRMARDVEKVKIIKASLYKEESGSDSDLSFLSSPIVRLNTEEKSKRREEEKMKEAWKDVTGMEWEEDEVSSPPLSIPQITNEAEAEIPTAAQSSAVMISEAEAEASNKDKGKRIMTKEDEERLQREKKEKEERRRRRREEEEMAETKKAQDRLTTILLREQQIQLYAKQLDELKVNIPAVYQIEEDEALALQLQEQFDKEEEEIEKKKKEEAKFRITDSELAKEMREEWVKALVSQGEDAEYLEKLSNKEIYRAFMGQQG
ncbi:hypothetical protein L1987_27477 [Smallanthus sonchifolius]|uniref:Uncharacterized protein n=1 Tax=Smallanthus sonchifolius TaxID=185202 RepID=A0ACB9IB75_9ASTR|nr:hypothetical protein L1987_27477 [Smallanthus sonchifolius]